MARRIFLFFLMLVAAGAQTPSPAPAPAPVSLPAPVVRSKKTEDAGFVFSLLPKSFQKNPELDVTVIGEVTEAGKKLPPVSPDAPAYYALFSAGYHPMGDSYGDKTLTADDIERVLTRSLAVSGYRAAKVPVRPSLLIIYVWGAHNRISDVEDDNVQGRNFLERAALVGGEKFAAKSLAMLQEQDAQRNMPVPPEVKAFINPFHQYELTSAKHASMLEQARDPLYYVIASAYDYAAAAKNQRRLLWRTRMTVDSAGVSQTQSLPALIMTAGPLFGKDMAEPEVLAPHVKEGSVEIGTPTVVPSDAPAAGATKK